MEQKYRMLEVGERTQQGDEFLFKGQGWGEILAGFAPVGNSWAGCFRRPLVAEDTREPRQDEIEKLTKERDAVQQEMAERYFKGLEKERQITDLTHRLENALSEKVIAKKHAETLIEEAARDNNVWREIYLWIEKNVKGCAGKRCCDVALDTLKSHASVVADKDAAIRRLKDKLENMETHTNAERIVHLEKQLVTLKEGFDNLFNDLISEIDSGLKSRFKLREERDVAIAEVNRLRESQREGTGVWLQTREEWEDLRETFNALKKFLNQG